MTGPGRPLAALGHRDFRVLLASSMALQIGSWVQVIGLGWLVLHDLDGSATNLGLVALLRGASLLVLSPLGGYLAGRLERRRQLVVYTVASAGIATAISALIMMDAVAIWTVYCTSIAAGLVEALAGPIRTLLVYDSVNGEDLTNAVALNALGGNAMRVFGPALGGALIGAVGTQGAFQVQAGCLIISAVLTLRLRPSAPDASAVEGVFRSVASGIAYVWHDRRMLTIVGMGLLPSLLVYPYVSFLPVFARDVLKSDQTGYGYLAAAVGLGSLAGGWAVAVTADRGKMGQRMVWACFLYCAFVGTFALMRNLWLAVAALAMAGVFHSIYSALQASMMQLQPKPEFRGRVMSLQTMMWGTTPFAALAMGRMIDVWGAPEVVLGWMVVAGVLTLAVALASGEMRRV